jgi:thioredoxin-dependent peroxiredoxin
MEGRHVPEIVFKTRVRDETVECPNPYRWEDVSTAELFRGRRVVVFSSREPLRRAVQTGNARLSTLCTTNCASMGLMAYCISVNDAFVMHQWSRALGLKHVRRLPDGNAQFTRRIGMLVNKEHLGFGYCSWRYAMVVDHGVIEKWFEEPGINDVGADNDPYGETDPDRVVEYLTIRTAQSQASRCVDQRGRPELFNSTNLIEMPHFEDYTVVRTRTRRRGGCFENISDYRLNYRNHGEVDVLQSIAGAWYFHWRNSSGTGRNST